jgi:hypothetical protein
MAAAATLELSVICVAAKANLAACSCAFALAEALPPAVPPVRPLRGPQALSVPTPAAIESTRFRCSSSGPSSSDKTETISSGQAACLAVHDPTWQVKFTFHGPMAELIRRRREQIGVRQPVDATVATADRRFGMELVKRNRELREPKVVGACSASLLDGSGGAAFPKNGDVVALSADMKEDRWLLIESGITARAIVIFINVMTEGQERCVAANITRLLAEMAVPTAVTLDDTDGNGSRRHWPFGRRTPVPALNRASCPRSPPRACYSCSTTLISSPCTGSRSGGGAATSGAGWARSKSCTGR